jgi:glycerol-3-phosphate dehydrogenase (NAD(P)+)
MGGEAVTFAGLAGMGDLVTTCISPHSRNRTVGEQLGAGRALADITAEMNMVAEGLKTAVTAHELAERFQLDLPVHDAIYRVVTGEMDAGHAYRGLRRPAGHEAEPG